MERKQSTMTKLKGKLISALCMLLVAATMVISSSYAWFTLSTAPEVSGITTAIGANGALEIWLNTTNTADENYIPGNIVNLGSELYGLNKINLLPAALNMIDATTIATNFLKFPEYGANGKPGALDESSAATGTFNGANFFENTDTGVRGVGTASGLTDRQAAYRNAKYAASTNMSLATSKAVTSLNTNGAILGNIVIKKATTSDATYTASEVTAIGNIVTDLEAAVAYIETAYEEMIVALAASALVPSDADVVYSTIRAKFADGSLTLEDIATEEAITVPVGESDFTVSLKTEGGADSALLAAIKALQTTKTNVASARSAYGTAVEAGGDSYTWNQLSGIITHLINIDATSLNRTPVRDIDPSGDLGSLASSIMSEGINIQLHDGAGVYVEIAAHCGNFNANVTMTNVSVAGMSFETLTANMATVSTQHPFYLQNALTQVEGAGMPGSEGAAAMPMTEFYGFILDLSFRTNAANSNLLLQTEAVDRIYEDNNNELTQGKGSYMTYKATTTELTTEQVKGLMECVRIVFFDPTNNKLIGEARLDVDTATVSTDGVTAKMYMYKNSALQNGTDTNNDSSITALAQNQEVKVSVLVYLDGENIKNEHVAATAESSVTGTMNLQFASDANLVPMEYGKLHTPATNNGGEGTN